MTSRKDSLSHMSRSPPQVSKATRTPSFWRSSAPHTAAEFPLALPTCSQVHADVGCLQALSN